MPLFTDTERRFAEALSQLTYCNPFLPERIDLERDALGEAFDESDVVWSMNPRLDAARPNIAKIRERVVALVEQARQRLVSGERAGRSELLLYEDLALYLLYAHYWERLHELITSIERGQAPPRNVEFYRAFEKGFAALLQVPGIELPSRHEPANIFASFFQIRRAFHYAYTFVIGRSLAAARLRASIWQSIFTHDMRRYRRALYERMGDFTTLITGASGTGKEIVARAIALSRYIPFDPRSRSFSENFLTLFHPLNLSALSPTLIESELFGHRRGAFTGALEDRSGWLEICQALGTVFLDEIGELDPVIQVKLLRVLQSREFQRLGDTKTRHFPGKIIAATNRDLGQEMAAGRFRRDFYYRLCSDIITTPTLREQIEQSPGELRHLVLYIAYRAVGEEAESLADEVEQWIGKHLGADYSWPGNFRELEQCVRNVLIRREYRPLRNEPLTEQDALARLLGQGSLTADELLRRYCQLVYRSTGSYEETARRLGIDRRTVKSKVTGRGVQ